MNIEHSLHKFTTSTRPTALDILFFTTEQLTVMDATDITNHRTIFDAAADQHQPTLDASMSRVGNKVTYDYHDYAGAPAGSRTKNSGLASNVEQMFPSKLHYMLDDMEKDGLSHIISWAPHGRCKCSARPTHAVIFLPFYCAISHLEIMSTPE